jgi:hypothetical protein
MPDELDHFGIGDVAMESRDPRFAELDAQIKASVADRQQRPATRKRKRQRAGPALPREIRKDITQFARELKRQHRHLFTADPKLKDRAARFLRSLLPPQRKRGRPGLDSVTRAIRLLKQFRRQFPHESPTTIWQRIYPQAIPNYDAMTKVAQKDARGTLRERVRWRQRRQAGRHNSSTTD